MLTDTDRRDMLMISWINGCETKLSINAERVSKDYLKKLNYEDTLLKDIKMEPAPSEDIKKVKQQKVPIKKNDPLKDASDKKTEQPKKEAVSGEKCEKYKQAMEMLRAQQNWEVDILCMPSQ